MALTDGDSSPPLVSFGVLTDVQYADCDDRVSWCSPDTWRYYRSSLDLVRQAFKTWRHQQTKPVSFVMQLGDLIDGCNSTLNLGSKEAARKTLDIFAEYASIPTYHVLGNHELYNFSRDEIQNYFGAAMSTDYHHFHSNASSTNAATKMYYSFSPAPSLLVVVLDCFDLSILGYDVDHPNHQQSLELLSKYHPTQDQALWEYDDHLQGMEKRFLSYNGAIGPDQLVWLEEELLGADRNQQKVIICGHVSILPESSRPCCVMWNYEEVLNLLHRHPCVVAYLAGHLHEAGYGMDNHGVHHVTFAGIIETSPCTQAFSTLHVFPDCIRVEGYGREKSFIMPFRESNVPEEASVGNAAMELEVQS